MGYWSNGVLEKNRTGSLFTILSLQYFSTPLLPKDGFQFFVQLFRGNHADDLSVKFLKVVHVAGVPGRHDGPRAESPEDPRVSFIPPT